MARLSPGNLANKLLPPLGIFRACRLARLADCPNRLIGKNDMPGTRKTFHLAQGHADLSLQDIGRLPTRFFLGIFTHTHKWLQTMLQR